jgi:heme exporter protein D
LLPKFVQEGAAMDHELRKRGTRTMDLGPHAAFIISAYAIAAVIVTGLVVWVLIDQRRQRRMLGDLEMRGLSRRSERASEGKK